MFNGRNPPVNWWNLEIAELRRHKTRRKATKAKSREEARELMQVHKEVKRSLRGAIRVSKIRCEMKLCLVVDNDP